MLTIINKISVAQNFHLVKDINSATDGSPANSNNNVFDIFPYRAYAVLNGISYFSANDGIHGVGLWRSDGTTAGTFQVKDSMNANNIIVSNGKLFFIAPGTTGLWKSDGTEAGTVPVLNVVPPGLTNFTPAGLTDFGSTVFFAVTGHRKNDQLWKTDGTIAGTILVKDFYDSVIPNNSLRDLKDLKTIKNKLYFSIYDYRSSTGDVTRLGVSNGSSSGTYIISQNVVEPGQMIAASSDISDPNVYFTGASTQNGDRTLYITNGDSGVANIVTGFNGIIANNYYSQELINTGGAIYFIGQANSITQTQSLCKFNIAAANGIEVLKTIPGSDVNGTSSAIDYLLESNGTLFFTSYDGPANKHQLWKSNGTSSGNILLKDDLYTYYGITANGLFYFTGSDKNGYELWKSDGTVNGTAMIKDISPGNNSSSPDMLTFRDSTLLFEANDGIHGIELWRSNGTAAGTRLVKDINQNATSSSYPYGLVAFGNSLIFSTNSGNGISNNAYLWKSNGAASGTTIINDTIVDQSFILNNAIFKEEFYFFGKSNSGRQGFYKTDGSSGGTVMIKDFTNVKISLGGITVAGDVVYFYLYNYITSHYELWRSDGTGVNTFILKNDFDFFYSDNFVVVGNTLFFVSNNGGGLWKTDGTVNGTMLVKSYIDDPTLFTAHKNLLYFTAYDPSGLRLWKSDGTPAGTAVVSDDVVNPASVISSNDQLFFTATGNASVYGDVAQELYTTDGTSAGTKLVKDIHPGSDGYTYIFTPVSLNGILYFFTNAATYGYMELWKSDGTGAGTQAICGNLGISNSTPYKVITATGKLYFVFNKILWEADGTLAGTRAVADNIFAETTLDDYTSDITAVGNQLYFAASSYQYGLELYSGNATPVVATYTSAINGNWSNAATWIGNIVPPAGANVIIRHNVISNVNASCNSLRIETPGKLTVNTGITIQFALNIV